MEQLKIVIVGHVDHGKSTFIGRLFHDTDSLPEGKLAQLQRIATQRGVPFEWANLMDSLQAERNQNITIDTAQIWFRTPRREYVIIDAPGHKEFLKNMVTGAASAAAAFLVIDAAEGVQENSRRHGYLLKLLGVRQVAVLVNKMDRVDYSRERFDAVVTEFRTWALTVGLEIETFIPISAREGDNIATTGANMPWWPGPTVLECLDGFLAPNPPTDRPLRFPVQDVYRFDARRILVGRVESGSLKCGDELHFSPAGKSSQIRSIERWSAPQRDAAGAGECIGITLEEQIFVERGDVASHEDNLPFVLTRFKARVFWMGRQPLLLDQPFKLKLTTQEVDASVTSFERVLDASTLDRVAVHPESPELRRHEVAELTIHCRQPVAFDTLEDNINLARFVVTVGRNVAGGGVILPDTSYPRPTSDGLHKSSNIFWTRGKVTREQRSERNGHPGRVIWLTGLSGSGKSSIATELERVLFNRSRHVYILDGDNVRHGLCKDLGFSPDDRQENIRRIGEVAKLFADSGMICITAFISPYRSDRELVRAIHPPGSFVEVYVNAPLEVCEARDPKGLYARARANEIKEFTGISAPYEPPQHPELEIRTDQLSVEQAVEHIVRFLDGR